MSNISVSSTRNEVLEAIHNGDITFFYEIPVGFQMPEIAIYWFEHSPGKTAYYYDFRYDQVPTNCRTDEFLMAAASQGCCVLKDTMPHQTTLYRELACLCITLSPYAMVYLDPAFRDNEMLERFFSCHPGEVYFSASTIEWLFDIMSDDLFDRCCKADFMFALEAPEHRMNGDLGRYLHLDKLNGHEIKAIRKMGRIDLIAAKLRDEPWPFPKQGADGEMMPIEPESMEKLLERLEKSDPGTPYEAVYMACLMREPIDVVVPAMASNRFKKMLMEMYSREALAPFMKADAGLRGVLLEEAMGL